MSSLVQSRTRSSGPHCERHVSCEKIDQIEDGPNSEWESDDIQETSNQSENQSEIINFPSFI